MATNQHSNQPPAPEMGRQTSQHGEHLNRRGFWGSKAALALAGFAVIAGFLLLSEHRAHALGYLPLLLILACPLLHIFMHGGHGGHSAHGKRTERSKPSNGGTRP